ncbi:MAG: L-fuculokinase [Bacteroidales bacterium]|nr:MAG: L-fuculokinase [Bacteroidales bacterium]
MAERVILVMDCGATNVRTVAVSDKGIILAQHSLPNMTSRDPFYKDYCIWDVHEIWSKLVKTTKEVLKKVDKKKIAGVTVTTFGVDGAPLSENGELLYPVISWQCERTKPVMDNIGKYMPLQDIFSITGLQPYSFNTINKLIWFKENKPEILESMHKFLFIPSIFIYFLTGEMVNDTTMAGTSMLTELSRQNYSKEIFDTIGVDQDKLCPLAKPGDIAGNVTGIASDQTGIPVNTPVIVAGHDTQFAIFGSGASENQPVLSSGTWEILMVRSKEYSTQIKTFNSGITTEFDAVHGLYNIGIMYVSSGIVEWVKKMFYGKEKGDIVYNTMINEALEIPAGSKGIMFFPEFFSETGSGMGSIMGISMDTTRGQIFRACIESLSFKSRHSLELLQEAGNFKAGSIICVGGGSKNSLWNQLRADVTGIPVKLIGQKETTVLGAALFALYGTGDYSNPYEVRDVINYSEQVIEPSSESKKYRDYYEKYLVLHKDHSQTYRNLI